MALSKKLEIRGVVIENCYIKVIRYHGDKKVFYFTVAFKANNEAESLQEINTSIEIDVSISKNFIAQAYEHLKTLPEFADAIDC